MKRWECLDGVRGGLAVYVLLGHMAPFAVLPGWIQTVVSHGSAAVDVFFVLSGLVIVMTLERAGSNPASFLISRVARIFPVYLPVLTVAVAVEALSCGFEGMPWIGPDNAARTICVMAWPHAWLPEVLAHLTMTQGLFPNAVLPDVWVSFLGAAWSLSTEWQFYLLALLLTNTSKRRLVTVLLALAAAGVLWRLAAPQPWLFSRAFLPNNAHYFALGVASVSLARRQPGALHRYCCVLGFTLAVCATQGSFGKLLPPLVWTLCLAAQMSPESPGLRPVHRLLRCRLARYFGAISYCLYLVNEPIHKVTSMVVSWVARGDPALYTTLWLPLAILLPIGVAAWLHVSLEMPALRLGRALAARAETGGAWFGGARLRVLGAARSWMPPPRRP